MPIFSISNNTAKQIKLSTFEDEGSLQNFIENNLEEIFSIKFIASEFSTGERHGGRIDTLGLDENGSPVIIEYKWGEKDNVINQGLFYLDWLIDHVGDFQIATEKKLGNVKIDWGRPRLILIASSFNRYDKYAINRMNENIELWDYTLYENGLFSIELEACSQPSTKNKKQVTKIDYSNYDLNYHLNKTSKELKEKFLDIREKILEFGGVKEVTEQKSGITYKTSKSFARFEFNKSVINLLLRDPKYIDPRGLVKDVTTFEWGYKGLVKIKPEIYNPAIAGLVEQSYNSTL